MKVYFLIIFIPTLLCYLNDYLKIKKNFFIWSSYIFLVIIAGLRYDFGADYQSYVEIYKAISIGYVTLYRRLEEGYILINKLFIFYNLHFNVMIAVISAFNLYLIYNSILLLNKGSKNFYLSIFTYLSIYSLFFYHLSMIRQSIAISIFLYSTRFILERKYIKYIFTILVACLFHKSSFILFMFYFFKKLKIKYKFCWIFYFLLIIFNFYKIYIIGLMIGLLKILKLEYYIHYIFTKQGGSIFNFKCGIIFLLTTFFIHISKNIKQVEYKLILNTMIINNFVYLFSMVTDILILNRIVDYMKIFYIFLPIIIIEYLKKLKLKKGLKIIKLLKLIYIVVLIIFFILTLNKVIDYYGKDTTFLYYKNIIYFID